MWLARSVCIQFPEKSPIKDACMAVSCVECCRSSQYLELKAPIILFRAIWVPSVSYVPPDCMAMTVDVHKFLKLYQRLKNSFWYLIRPTGKNGCQLPCSISWYQTYLGILTFFVVLYFATRFITFLLIFTCLTLIQLAIAGLNTLF